MLYTTILPAARPSGQIEPELCSKRTYGRQSFSTPAIISMPLFSRGVDQAVRNRRMSPKRASTPTSKKPPMLASGTAADSEPEKEVEHGLDGPLQVVLARDIRSRPGMN